MVQTFIVRKRGNVLGLCLLAALLGSVPATAQQTGPGTAALPAAPQDKPASSPESRFPVIRIPSYLVSTPVVVTDSRGDPVYGLSKDDFRVYDNGRLQSIRRLDIGTSPLSVVILVQTSDSIAPLLENVKPLAPIFSSLLVGTRGQAAVIFYNRMIKRVQPFSSSPTLLDKTFTKIAAGGPGARLNDALMQAIDMLRESSEDDRRIIVAIGTGFDSGSKSTRADVIQGASGAKVQIYGLGLSTTKALLKSKPDEQMQGPANSTVAGPPPPGMPATPDLTQTINEQPIPAGDIAVAASKVIASRIPYLHQNRLALYSRFSGGTFFPQWSPKILQDHLDQMALEIQSQYQLAYIPNDLTQTGFHRIIVRVERRGVRVRAREGYFYYTPVPQGKH